MESTITGRPRAGLRGPQAALLGVTWDAPVEKGELLRCLVSRVPRGWPGPTHWGCWGPCKGRSQYWAALPCPPPCPSTRHAVGRWKVVTEPNQHLEVSAEGGEK